ncbi:TonB-dependent receptor [Brevundimonas sp.]|uniref:TonB-dependent receptor n=1 Tax=Brevundimonas sp. TaxID=1871086 RepID=UPI003D126751
MIRQRVFLLGAVSAFALSGALCSADDAAAQTAGNPQTPQTGTAASDVLQQEANDRLDEVVVTGFRGAYASALATKRSSDQITDSISSDGLGRFPDLNVGEAIQRLPGVQINREADSRNATISLRGLPGSFARTTLNGSGFADPILSTSTNMASMPLGAFNSDIFSGITIIKSPDASNVAGGLSGIIDLRIAPALSRRDGGFVKAAYEYNELGSQGSPSYTVGYNTHLSEDFAVFGTLAFKEENFRRDSITVNSWANRLGSIQVGNQGVPGTNPVYDALIAANPGGVYYPSQVRQFVRQNRGDVFTGAAGFEWQATNEVRFGLTGFYTKRQLDEGTNHLLYIENGAGQNTNTALNATSAVTRFTSLGTPYVAADGRAYINEFSSVNAQTFDSIRSEPVTQQVWAINPTVTFENDEWHATLEGTISRAEARSDQIELDIVQNANRNLGPAGLNGITSSVFTGGSDLSRFRIALNTPNATHIPAGGYTIPVASNSVTQVGAVMPGQLATVPGDRFGVTGTNGQALTELDAVQFDLERTLTGSFLSSLMGGLRFESTSFASSGSRNSAMGINLAGLTQSVSEVNPYVGDFFGGQAGGYTQAWRSVNVRQVLAAITPVNTALRTATNPNGLTNQFLLDPTTGVFLTTYGLVNNYWDPNYWNNNFTNSNDTFSAYAMARFDTEVFGFPTRGNVGVRYERLDTSIVALDCQGCSSVRSTAPGAVNHFVTERSYDSEHDYLLPSAMVKVELKDDLLLRAAYYRTYVRPQPRDNVPITSVLTPDPAVVNSPYTITIGATNLSPYTSDAYDLALEWYNRPGGVFAISLYQKDVDGYIGPIVDPTRLCPSNGLINGVDFGLGPLTISGTNCLTSAGVQVQASGSTNQDPITVRGAELAVQQNLDFLPGWLSHFGGAANFTYIDIEGTTGAGVPITLPNVSRKNLNLIGYYETDQFGIRLTWNWRGDYDLAAGNSFVGDARTVESRSQLDASASYNVTDRITLSADAFNLTDATRSEYQSDPMLPRRIDYDGRTYQLTLRATF